MDPRLYPLEPFPSYYEAPPNPQFESRWSGHPLMSSSYLASNQSGRVSRGRSLSRRISNTLRLRYYQYEVTFGLYMMDAAEKLVLNVLFLVILAVLAWGVCIGLAPFIVHTFCRLLYYATGSLQTCGRSCAGAAHDFKELCASDRLQLLGPTNTTMSTTMTFT